MKEIGGCDLPHVEMMRMINANVKLLDSSNTDDLGNSKAPNTTLEFVSNPKLTSATGEEINYELVVESRWPDNPEAFVNMQFSNKGEANIALKEINEFVVSPKEILSTTVSKFTTNIIGETAYYIPLTVLEFQAVKNKQKLTADNLQPFVEQQMKLRNPAGFSYDPNQEIPTLTTMFDEVKGNSGLNRGVKDGKPGDPKLEGKVPPNYQSPKDTLS